MKLEENYCQSINYFSQENFSCIDGLFKETIFRYLGSDIQKLFTNDKRNLWFFYIESCWNCGDSSDISIRAPQDKL